MFKRILIFVLLGAFVGFAATGTHRDRHHRRGPSHRTSKKIRSKARVAARLPIRFSHLGEEFSEGSAESIEEARALLQRSPRCSNLVLHGAAKFDDSEALKKSKRKRIRGSRVAETKVTRALFALVALGARVQSPRFALGSPPPLPRTGSGPCHTLPRPRECLIRFASPIDGLAA